jgi:AhpD family alkylhydroperoxidase
LTLALETHEALLALGIAATVGCEGCIEHHVDDAINAGASLEEIQRTIDLAHHLGGRLSSTCCEEALAALSPTGDR